MKQEDIRKWELSGEDVATAIKTFLMERLDGKTKDVVKDAGMTIDFKMSVDTEEMESHGGTGKSHLEQLVPKFEGATVTVTVEREIP